MSTLPPTDSCDRDPAHQECLPELKGSPGLNGVLVNYEDDQINDSVKAPLQRKSRVRYKCMDAISNFLAFGTSSGAVYLYCLDSLTHASCSLISIVPCDQGSIEVIRFLLNVQSDDLLVAIGTSRGSLVVFKFTQQPDEQAPICSEIYKAECFANNSSIKFIEHDQELSDSRCIFTKLYICDSTNRVYVLDSGTIFGASKQTLRLFYQANHLPSLVFSVNDSNINQISVNRSYLLISTDETTRLFNEQTNQFTVIGKKKRREGFYGACFFNPNYQPIKIAQINPETGSRSVSSSSSSLNDGELLIFVARPMFRLWHVNNLGAVMFTHQFDILVKGRSPSKVIKLDNKPLDKLSLDDPSNLMAQLSDEEAHAHSASLQTDHFERLSPIYSQTLGNLLMSYTRNEIFIVNPITAELVVWYRQDEPILKVISSENELFIWTSVQEDDGQRQFFLKRIFLLAPTQVVLELHRTRRFLSLMAFVQKFTDLFCQRMALPLSGTSTITTEGGLLRNVLLNAWDVYNSQDSEEARSVIEVAKLDVFKTIIESILEESKQLKLSIEDLRGSRFFLNMTNENIDRLCSEPYISLVSLEVSIADLHTSHVVHFSKAALKRHKSVANLARNLQNVGLIKSSQAAKSIGYLADANASDSAPKDMEPQDAPQKQLCDNKVAVERRKPKRRFQMSTADLNVETMEPLAEEDTKSSKVEREDQMFFSTKSLSTREADCGSDRQSGPGSTNDASDNENTTNENTKLQCNTPSELEEELTRCPHCRWPLTRSHLKHLTTSQREKLNSIEEKLMGNFEENIDRIQELAFEHGLWPMFMRCLTFKNQLEDYITCCIMLDDVRLLNIEKFIVTRFKDDELMTLLLEHLSRIQRNASNGTSKSIDVRHCIRCEKEFDDKRAKSASEEARESGAFSKSQQVKADDNGDDDDDDISFNLMNLLEKFVMRRDAHVNKIIDAVLRYPDLLNQSRIPSTFYLKVIATSVVLAQQSQLSRTRMRQLRGTREVNL